ncbi:MAG: DegT/DnrJ/EryC1/StrS family aminotransferase [Candidatus Riflebacteria bacterium]|nr:DegT/DnrJ/EryC1/StrS family aminotransferase [Candidatus Riflebacteria bacterium]
MKVPLLDLKPQFAQIKEKLVPKLIELMEQQTFILGPAVEKMEKELAEYIGTKYSVGVSSGTDALLISLMGLGIGEGDEVITTPYSFFATAGCIQRVGAKPIFVDIEPDTYNIDVSKIEAAITARTKAILPVHLYGQAVDMNEINAIAKKHKLDVIEDACQAISARYNEKMVGNLGTAACFSFFPSKNLGCFGDGGLITTNNEELYKKMKSLRVHGMESQYFHKSVGINGRLDAMQAVVVSTKLPLLESWSDGRRRNAEKYSSLLSKNKKIGLPVQRADRKHIFNQFILKLKDRDALKNYLSEKNIGCAIYYPLPLHLQECFSYLGKKTGDFPISEEAARTTLAIPIYPELTDEAIKYVSDTINSFSTQNSEKQMSAS